MSEQLPTSSERSSHNSRIEANTVTEEKLTRRQLVASLEQCTERLDLAFEPSTSYFEVVTLGLDVLEFGLESAHLVDALLTIAARSQCVGFALFDLGRLRGKRTCF